MVVFEGHAGIPGVSGRKCSPDRLNSVKVVLKVTCFGPRSCVINLTQIV